MHLRKSILVSAIVWILLISNVSILNSHGINPNFDGVIETRATNFEYHNYSFLESELKALNTKYPGLMELSTAQDDFGLPDCRDGYKIWIVKITNESLTDPKPEVLYIAGHHGNEQVSIETAYYFIAWLLNNYHNNSDIQNIVDNRELYIIPVLNPYGWENDIRYDGTGEDMNRDYPYGNASDNKALTTVGSRAVHELTKAHMFTMAISWHSGAEVIYYAWGTLLHDTISFESPDNTAFNSVGKRLSAFAGNYHSYYNYGPANQVLYDADGAWSDYAYAKSWDSAGMPGINSTNGARTLSFGVEISHQKKPPEGELGSVIDLYAPPEQVKGYIPKNIRLGFALAELAEPYVEIVDGSEIPKTAEPGEKINFSWKVGGAVNVASTNVHFGTESNPSLVFNYSTANQTGTTDFLGKSFQQTVTMPDSVGRYYFTIRARVDQDYRLQVNPDPTLPPQSFYVNSRTNESWTMSNGGKTINGQIDYFSEVVVIDVIPRPLPSIKILEYPESGLVNESVSFRWELEGRDDVKDQYVYRSQNQDDIIGTGLKIGNGITEHNNSGNHEYTIELNLPSEWGYYFYQIESVLNDNSSILSAPFTIFVEPYVEIVNVSTPTFVNEIITVNYLIVGTNIPFNTTIELFENNSLHSYTHKIKTEYKIGAEGHHSIQTIAPPFGGNYSVGVLSTYFDPIKDETFNFKSNKIPFIVQDRIFIKFPDNIIPNEVLGIDEIFTSFYIRAECSNKTHGLITNENVVTAEYYIYDDDGNFIHKLNLIWSGSQWFLNLSDLEKLPGGKYFAIFKFYDGIHSYEFAGEENEKVHFFIPIVNGFDDRNQSDEEPSDDNQKLLQFSLIIVISVIIIILMILFARKPPKKTEEESEDIEGSQVEKEPE